MPTADLRANSKATDQAGCRGANTKNLTKAIIDKVPYPDAGQTIIWEIEQKGLSVLVSKTTKTFRATFRIDHKKATPRPVNRNECTAWLPIGFLNRISFIRIQTSALRRLANKPLPPPLSARRGTALGGRVNPCRARSSWHSGDSSGFAS